jgi:hypothetical protein
MENKKLIRFVESFILLPVMTISMPFGNLPKTDMNIDLTPQAVLSQKLNNQASGLFAFNQAENKEAKILKIKANAVDAYFKEHDMPLEGTGLKMVQEAEKNGLDWRLVAAIAITETTGGKNLCKNPKAQNNPFGWGSCKIGFESIDESIEKVAKHLGGNMESTKDHYAGKNTEEILKTYNPPSIVKNYSNRVMAFMNQIGDKDIALIDTNKNT